MHMPAGSYYVPMNQPLARIIMAMLHPAAPDALVRWGFMDAIFERTGRIGAAEYLSVPIAAKMAADHPELWQQFQTQLTNDPAFAADPDARLKWWLSRSNYQPSVVNKIPYRGRFGRRPGSASRLSRRLVSQNRGCMSVAAKREKSQSIDSVRS